SPATATRSPRAVSRSAATMSSRSPLAKVLPRVSISILAFSAISFRAARFPRGQTRLSPPRRVVNPRNGRDPSPYRQGGPSGATIEEPGGGGATRRRARTRPRHFAHHAGGALRLGVLREPRQGALHARGLRRAHRVLHREGACPGGVEIGHVRD